MIKALSPDEGLVVLALERPGAIEYIEGDEGAIILSYLPCPTGEAVLDVLAMFSRHGTESPRSRDLPTTPNQPTATNGDEYNPNADIPQDPLPELPLLHRAFFAHEHLVLRVGGRVRWG